MRKYLAILLLLALTNSVTLTPCLSEGASRAVIYSDGSLSLELSLRGIQAPFSNGFVSIEAKFLNASFIDLEVKGFLAEPVSKEVKELELSINATYSPTLRGAKAKAFVKLFEDLGELGWIEIYSFRVTEFDLEKMVRADRIELSIEAEGAMRNVVLAASSINKDVIQSQLRNAGATWINVTEAKARVSGNRAFVTISFVANLAEMAKSLVKANESSRKVLEELAPTDVFTTCRYEVRSYGNSTKFELVARAKENLSSLLNALSTLLLVPTVGAKGAPVATGLSEGLSQALGIAKLVQSAFYTRGLRISPSTLAIEINASKRLATIFIKSPRLSIASENPLGTLIAIAKGFEELESKGPQWLRSLASRALNEGIELVSPRGKPLISGKVVLSDLLKGIVRKITISVSIVRTSSSSISTHRTSVTSLSTSTKPIEMRRLDFVVLAIVVIALSIALIYAFSRRK